tara:strand:- start:5021 stop:5296 length:276 start_codon:yes stop_codon:yes gene_type:complete
MNDYDYRQYITDYLDLRLYDPGNYRDTMWKYRDMATGGDGGIITPWPDDWAQIAVDSGWEIKAPTYRQYHYPDAPDMFFTYVLYGLGHMTD